MLATILFAILRFLAIAIKVGIPVLLVIFLIKGIKYLNQKNKEKEEKN